MHGLLAFLVAFLPQIDPSALQRLEAPPPAVEEIHVDKSDHVLELRAGGHVVKSYKVALGPGGAGPKRFEGDKVTPTGTYRITGRIPKLFHQFLVVGYPNAEDRARFADLKKEGGVPPGKGIGFGIGIHGVDDPAWEGKHKATDWTLGCIALDDDEIDEVARLVKDGTLLTITD